MFYKEYTTTTCAPGAEVWSLWADVQNWKQWDNGIEFSSIEGDFKNGAKGALKTFDGPRAVFTLTDCVKNKSFTSRLRLPLCTVDFGHELTDDGGGFTIKHYIKIYGPLTFIFQNVIGKNAAKGLKPAVDKLVALVEESQGRSK